MPAHLNPPNRTESEILARIKALTGKVESLAELVAHRRVGSTAAALGRWRQRQGAPQQEGTLRLGLGTPPAGSSLYTGYDLPHEEEMVPRGLLDGGKRRTKRSKRARRTRRGRK